MTLQARSNSAYSTVAVAPITPTAGVALTVAAGEGARFSGITTPFYATVWASGAQPVWAAGGATGGNFEIVQVTAVVVDVLTIVRAQEGTTARSVVVGDQIAETLTAQTFRDAQNMPRSARSSNTILAMGDGGKVICATSAFTQTLTAAATLGAGWWCVIKNDTNDGTTVLVVDPNGSETIDGLTTITMYSGETRLIECDGSNFTSQMLKGGYAKFTPTGGNFIVPAGVELARVVCIGSGGQGGGGFSGATGSGGGAGGGGAVSTADLRAADLGSAGATITVTVAAGGTGSGTAGNAGANGATTSFGTLLKAGGGGGGGAGQSGANSVGGGGGSVINSAATSTAGSPSSASAAIGGQAGGPGTGAVGISSEWGGAGGGGATSGSATGRAGGSAIYGGPAGGAGGSSATTTGQAGGTTQSYAAGGGGAAGGSGASPSAGSDGVFIGPYCGSGGGGGGGTATAAVTAGKGGNGGIAAGGGGGGVGGGVGGVGGAGGNGGAGECRVWYS